MWVGRDNNNSKSQESALQTGQSWNPACTLPEPTIRFSCPSERQLEREWGGGGGGSGKLWRTTNAFNTQLTFVYVAHAAGACVTSVCKVRWHELQLQLHHQRQQHKLQLLMFASCSWQLSLSAAKGRRKFSAGCQHETFCLQVQWKLTFTRCHVGANGNTCCLRDEEPRKDNPPPLLPPSALLYSL